jgi:hypothetical protein
VATPARRRPPEKAPPRRLNWRRLVALLLNLLAWIGVVAIVLRMMTRAR